MPFSRSAPEAPARNGIRLGQELADVHTENVHPLRLRLLLEVERRGSISAAADACSISQPSASVHLRTLETAIGQRLMTRNGRGSVLTTAGDVVASHAARVLATLESMRRGLDELEARGGGELVVAASLTPSVALIPAVLGRFVDQYPGVRVSLRTVPSGTAVLEVARAGADIALAGDVPTEEDVVRRRLLEDELVGIAAPGVLATDGGWVSLAALARSRLLVGGDRSSTRLATERCLTRAGYRPSDVWEFNSYETIKHAVAAGLGVSFISRSLISEDVERGDLTAFRVSGVEQMQRPIDLVQPGAREPTPQAMAFIGLLAGARPTPARRRRMVSRPPTLAGLETRS